jgi:hypothetical protein
MPTLPALLHKLALMVRVHAMAPDVALADAYDHAAAAVEAATPQVSAELLLAIAYVESHYDRTATSRVEGHRRRTGSYPSTRPPGDLATHASLYCGPLQTFAASWDECIALRDLRAAYAAGIAEMEQWLHDKRVRGRVELALAGHGCGNHGVVTGKCNGYPARVFRIAKRLQPPPVVRTAPRGHAET